MRAEQTLGMYSFENFAFHILHQRYEGPPQWYHSHYELFSESQSIRLVPSRNGFVLVLQASRLVY